MTPPNPSLPPSESGKPGTSNLKPPNPERRQLLKVLAAAPLVALCPLALARCGNLVGPPHVVQSDLVANSEGVLTIPQALHQSPAFAELANPGGALVLRAGGMPPLLLMRVEDGTLHAVSALCTHQGCLVNYHPTKQLVECPCHGAQFTTQGTHLKSPATQDLIAYQVTIDPKAGDWLISPTI